MNFLKIVLVKVVFFELCSSQNASISSVDAVGPFTLLLSAFFKKALVPVPENDTVNCMVETLAALGTEINLSLRPRGRCSYCCPLKKPLDYISIYLTLKNTNETIKLKLIKKRGYLQSHGFNKNLVTILYIHGFSEHGLGVSAKEIQNAYLSRDEVYNVMVLDWGRLAMFPWYAEAVVNVRMVGALLGEFIKYYANVEELYLDKLHLIGFSLGSHIAGLAGKILGKHKIARITGLDPAFPLFSLTDTTERLSVFDAKYVDVIHSDGGIFGFPISIGHADFYPNGGKLIQPGCEPSQLAEERNFISIVLCNHFRAWKFYAESVNDSESFPATHCGIMEGNSWTRCNFTTHNHMGHSVNKSVLGNFYLRTRNVSPYSKTAQEQFFAQDEIRLTL